MYCEEQRERGDGLLPAGEVGHGLEALARRHAVVVDAVQVRLLRVLRAQERLRRLVHRQRLRTYDDDQCTLDLLHICNICERKFYFSLHILDTDQARPALL